MLPIEKNARQLVALAQHFPSGAATSDELRAQTALPGPAFYEALRYAKEQRWLMLRLENDRVEYLVDSQAVPPLEELPDECLPERNSGADANGANVALPSLVGIVSDDAASMRQRIRAAAAVLGYKTHDDGVTEFVKRFLGSVCASADIPVDHKIEAGELLRRHEAPRVMSGSVRPSYSEGTEADRIAAWQHYEEMQLRFQITVETMDVPKPGWADHINSDSYQAPPGWPPKIRLPSPS
jgi:hypothetical protein